MAVKKDKKTPEKDSIEFVYFSVNTPQLLKEILDNKTTQILRIPLAILAERLGDLAEYIIEKYRDDDVLISILANLSLLSFADPYCKEDFNQELRDRYNEIFTNHLNQKNKPECQLIK